VKALAELRDWISFVLSGVGAYLAWRWRPRDGSRDVTIRVPAAVARAVMPTPALVIEPADVGTQAMLDSMAEVFPYEFPPN
jgi:hypothetical protein